MLVGEIDYEPAATAAYGLALGWQQRGDIERATRYFEQAIDADDRIHAAYVGLSRIWRDAEDWERMADICRRGVQKFPWTAYLHKHLTEALVHSEGFDAAEAQYRLVYRSGADPSPRPDDIVSISVVRNERARLPEFLGDARRLGADTFFVVDNGSTDGTIEFLLEQPDVRLWTTDLPFKEGNHGAGWFEVLLRRYAVGHWVLMLDADELLRYPGCEHSDLRELTGRLDRMGYRALEAMTLDMYSDRPLDETVYHAGDRFLDCTPFFDRTTHHSVVDGAAPFNRQKLYVGGLRQRIFGANTDFWLTKTPLLRYDADTTLVSGQHFASVPVDEVLERGAAVLHFKYFSTFTDHVRLEAERQQHASMANCYKAYDAVTSERPDLSFHDVEQSVRYTDSRQLVDLDIVDVTDVFTETATKATSPVSTDQTAAGP